MMMETACRCCVEKGNSAWHGSEISMPRACARAGCVDVMSKATSIHKDRYSGPEALNRQRWHAS